MPAPDLFLTAIGRLTLEVASFQGMPYSPYMPIAASPPIEIPLEQLSVKQKWQLVQTLCDDIAGYPQEELDLPDWHLAVLQEREERIAKGDASWMPLEDAIRSLEAKFA
jgi:Putative addiction module component